MKNMLLLLATLGACVDASAPVTDTIDLQHRVLNLRWDDQAATVRWDDQAATIDYAGQTATYARFDGTRWVPEDVGTAFVPVRPALANAETELGAELPWTERSKIEASAVCVTVSTWTIGSCTECRTDTFLDLPPGSYGFSGGSCDSGTFTSSCTYKWCQGIQQVKTLASD